MTSLYYVGAMDRGWLDLAHVYVWPILIILISVAAWSYWVTSWVDRARA